MSTGTDNQETVERTDVRSLVPTPLPVLEHDSGKEPVDWRRVGRQVWRCAWISALVLIATTGALIVAVVALVVLSVHLLMAINGGLMVMAATSIGRPRWSSSGGRMIIWRLAGRPASTRLTRMTWRLRCSRSRSGWSAVPPITVPIAGESIRIPTVQEPQARANSQARGGGPHGTGSAPRDWLHGRE